MCTLSWARAPDGGYWVFFNRDERRTRAPGRPPALVTVAGTRALAPADGDFGGTWIGVNQHGVTAALLNRYEDAPNEPGPARISRGLLLRDLLAAPSAAGLVRTLTAADLSAYQPFTIAAFERGGPVRLVDWTSRALELSETDAVGLLRTSSGRDQREAERIRAATFAEAIPGGRVTPGRLRALHQSHQPERGPFSVCMHREEAETQSATEVRVSARAAALRYHPGPPCVTPQSITRRLALRTGDP